MNAARIAIVVSALAVRVYGQAFDVASVRESDPAATRAGVRSTIETNPGSVTIRNTTLREAVRWAYDEPGARIGVVGGPEWVDTVRFDIVARPAASSSDTQVRVMLRALLADRFKLVVRADKKENPVYLLRVDQTGHKLRPSKSEGTRRMQPDPTGITFGNVTMADLQRYLLTVPSLDRPVINRTDLDGAFDFRLDILTEADNQLGKAAVAGGGFPVFAAALKALGLRLEPGTVPLDVITIEKVERPSEN